jgi:hypothetical protein
MMRRKNWYGKRAKPTPQNARPPCTKLTLASELSHRAHSFQIKYTVCTTSTYRIPVRANIVQVHPSESTMADSDSDTASSAGSIVEDASEPDTTTFKCLFCDQQWTRVSEMSIHCKEQHNFDLQHTIKNLGSGSLIMLRALPIWDATLIRRCRCRRAHSY